MRRSRAAHVPLSCVAHVLEDDFSRCFGLTSGHFSQIRLALDQLRQNSANFCQTPLPTFRNCRAHKCGASIGPQVAKLAERLLDSGQMWTTSGQTSAKSGQMFGRASQFPPNLGRALGHRRPKSGSFGKAGADHFRSCEPHVSRVWAAHVHNRPRRRHRTHPKHPHEHRPCGGTQQMGRVARHTDQCTPAFWTVPLRRANTNMGDM